MRFRCPAKLNLFLSVGPPDARGWHPLRTIFQAISLGDEIEIERSDADEFFCHDPAVPAENTVTRAWRLLSEVVSLPPLRVELTKEVPPESGLGAGSSDAASFLRGALAVSGQTVSDEVLLQIASRVGADVPFFLLGGRAKAEGYGEILTPLSDPEEEHYVIVRPEVSCSTPAMFSALDQLSYEWRAFPNLEDGLATGALYNDFERVAPCECLDLIERLQVHGAKDAALTGSGSAVFGRFLGLSDAAAAAEKLGQEGYRYIRTAHSLGASESLILG